jgi:prevent-host-death family protein
MKLADVSPITELKRDAAGLIRKAAKQRSPIVITQNGKATAVLQGADEYEEDQRAFALLRLAIEGERDIADGNALSYQEHRKRMTALLAKTRR